MRADRLMTLGIAVVVIGSLLVVSGPKKPAPSDLTFGVPRVEATGPFGLPPGVFELGEWAVRVAVLVFFMVVAWRVMRALEAIASSARRVSDEPPPPA